MIRFVLALVLFGALAGCRQHQEIRSPLIGQAVPEVEARAPKETATAWRPIGKWEPLRSSGRLPSGVSWDGRLLKFRERMLLRGDADIRDVTEDSNQIDGTSHSHVLVLEDAAATSVALVGGFKCPLVHLIEVRADTARVLWTRAVCAGPNGAASQPRAAFFVPRTSAIAIATQNAVVFIDRSTGDGVGSVQGSATAIAFVESGERLTVKLNGQFLDGASGWQVDLPRD